MRKDFKTGGPVIGNLPWVRGTSRPGVRKAPRGAEHKEAIKQEKTYVKADREIIPGKQTPVSYTKSRWKNWKKTKKQQYKRIEAQREQLPPQLKKLVPKLQRAFPRHDATGKLIKGNK